MTFEPGKEYKTREVESQRDKCAAIIDTALDAIAAGAGSANSPDFMAGAQALAEWTKAEMRGHQ